MPPPLDPTINVSPLALIIDGIVSVLVYVLVALDNGAGTVVLVVIDNPGYVILVVSSPADNKAPVPSS